MDQNDNAQPERRQDERRQGDRREGERRKHWNEGLRDRLKDLQRQWQENGGKDSPRSDQ